ncbi:MAG: NADH-quinone oxidoreductase subunit C [Candidatus Atribacteria bacterium]|nr:NADH-quinone oxidoreductase subunit C [Candidatus Atribacteria bacterium]
MEYIKPEKIIELFKEKFNGSVTNNKIETKTAGLKKNSYSLIWLEIELKDFKEAVKFLCTIQFPHFAIISDNDTGEEIKLTYHFSIYYGERFKEISLNLATSLPKNNLKIPSITDLIPGAQTSEREIKEMMGVTFEELPDLPNVFLPIDFTKGVYPLRKDEKGVYPLSKNGKHIGGNITDKEEEVKKVE